jgi:hypothetical protein
LRRARGMTLIPKANSAAHSTLVSGSGVASHNPC